MKRVSLRVIMLLVAFLLLCAGAWSCGSDDVLQWGCECTGGKTTFICTTNSTEAEAEAYAQICEGAADCSCTCVNTYVPFGC